MLGSPIPEAVFRSVGPRRFHELGGARLEAERNLVDGWEEGWRVLRNLQEDLPN